MKNTFSLNDKGRFPKHDAIPCSPGRGDDPDTRSDRPCTDEYVAVLARKGEIHFYIHTATSNADAIRKFAEGEGSEVIVSHLRDHDAIRKIVADCEQDVGGEG